MPPPLRKPYALTKIREHSLPLKQLRTVVGYVPEEIDRVRARERIKANKGNDRNTRHSLTRNRRLAEISEIERRTKLKEASFIDTIPEDEYKRLIEVLGIREEDFELTITRNHPGITIELLDEKYRAIEEEFVDNGNGNNDLDKDGLPVIKPKNGVPQLKKMRIDQLVSFLSIKMQLPKINTPEKLPSLQETIEEEQEEAEHAKEKVLEPAVAPSIPVVKVVKTPEKNLLLSESGDSIREKAQQRWGTIRKYKNFLPALSSGDSNVRESRSTLADHWNGEEMHRLANSLHAWMKKLGPTNIEFLKQESGSRRASMMSKNPLIDPFSKRELEDQVDFEALFNTLQPSTVAQDLDSLLLVPGSAGWKAARAKKRNPKLRVAQENNPPEELVNCLQDNFATVLDDYQEYQIRREKEKEAKALALEKIMERGFDNEVDDFERRFRQTGSHPIYQTLQFKRLQIGRPVRNKDQNFETKFDDLVQKAPVRRSAGVKFGAWYIPPKEWADNYKQKLADIGLSKMEAEFQRSKTANTAHK